jgi:hypothetical protein
MFFPRTVAFTQIEGSFPATPAFYQHIRDMVRERGGPAYVVFNAKYNWRVDNVAKMNRIVGALGLTGSAKGCGTLQSVISRWRLHARVESLAGNAGGVQRRLGLRADDVRDLDAENRQLAEQAQPILERYGFGIDPLKCSVYRAYAGTGVSPYAWCRVTLRDASGPAQP